VSAYSLLQESVEKFCEQKPLFWKAWLIGRLLLTNNAKNNRGPRADSFGNLLIAAYNVASNLISSDQPSYANPRQNSVVAFHRYIGPGRLGFLAVAL
jgi:hypothetical protein